MSIEYHSLESLREASGVESEEVVRFCRLFANVRPGVDRKTLIEFWVLVKDKNEAQLEALAAAYLQTLPDTERQNSSLPATLEALVRTRLALKLMMEKPGKFHKPVDARRETSLQTPRPENNSGKELAARVAGNIKRKARDAVELEMAVSDPQAFWKMMENLEGK